MADRILRLVANVDVRKFKLDPTDGFVLSRLDGRLGVKELAHETGLADDVVAQVLEKLERLGIVASDTPSTSLRTSASPLSDTTDAALRSSTPPTSTSGAPSSETRRGIPEFVTIGAPKYDPRELDEEVDLTVDEKRRILDVYYRLDDLDHFTILGLSHEADKKAVKRAYFELASLLHPDRYFKKRLGSFKAKMEIVFDRITEAHDTLVDRDRRKSYEAELADGSATLGMEALFERALEEKRRASLSTPPSQPHQSVVPVSEAASARPTTPTSTASFAAVRTLSPTMPPAKPAGQEASPEELRARKEALARRLRGAPGSSTPARPSTSPPSPPTSSRPVPPHDHPSDAVESLKRRYAERIESVAAAQARAHLDHAERALQQGDVASASASFKAAAKYAPQDAETIARMADAKRDAQEALLANAHTQADQAEKNGRTADAARAWMTIAKIRVGDPYAHHKVATLLLQSADGNLHEAAEHAKKAVLLEPRKPDFHVTLAEIYLRAGLLVSARKAAETGLNVAPDDAALRAVLKKTEKTKT